MPEQAPDIDFSQDILQLLAQPVPAVTALVEQAEAEYLHWDKLRFIARSKKQDPRLVWSLVKMARMSGYKALPLHGHHRKLQYTITPKAQRQLMLIDQHLAGRIQFDEEKTLTDSQKEKFILSALREEAIASSMIEGAATTRREAKAMLASGRKPRSRGEQMVLNNYKTILFIRDHLSTDLSPDFLLELQAMLTKDTLDDPTESGRYRTGADQVEVVDPYGEVLHVPPPARELKHRLSELCDFANAPFDADRFVHPVLRACILHFQVGYDHPFCDGNGRTARALFYWHMLRNGYWLFEFLPISRLIAQAASQYGRAYLYTETDSFDVTYFLHYKLQVIDRARNDFIEYVIEKQRKLVHARRAFRDDPHLNHRQHDVLLQMARNPDGLVTIKSHQIKHQVSYPTARSDLFDLVDNGYLVKSLQGKRFEFLRGPRIDSLDTPPARGAGSPLQP